MNGYNNAQTSLTAKVFRDGNLLSAWCRGFVLFSLLLLVFSVVSTKTALAYTCSYALSDHAVDLSSTTVAYGGGSITATAKAKIKTSRSGSSGSGASTCAASVSSVLTVTLSQKTGATYSTDGSFSPSATCNLDVTGVTTVDANNGLTGFVSCSRTFQIPAGTGSNDKYAVKGAFAGSSSGSPTVAAGSGSTPESSDINRTAGTKTLSITVGAPATYTAASTSIAFTYTITNTGETALPAATISDNVTGFSCALAGLSAGATASCADSPKSYTLYDAEKNVGQSVTSNVDTNNFSGKNNWIITRTQATSTASGSFDRTIEVWAEPAADTYTASDTQVTFTYYAKNTGNFVGPTGSTLGIKDRLFQGTDGDISCNTSGLAIGATVPCGTLTYDLKDTDLVSGGEVVTDLAERNGGTSNLAGWTFSPITNGKYSAQGNFARSFSVVVSVSPTVYPDDTPATITFSYLVTNTGDLPIPSVVTLDDQDNKIVFGSECDLSGLTSGQTKTCTGTYDYDAQPAKLAIDSNARVNNNPSNLLSDWTVTILNASAISQTAENAPTVSLSSDKVIFDLGDIITFTAVVNNMAPNTDPPKLKVHVKGLLLNLTGNPGLDMISSGCQGADKNLDPGESCTEIYQYTITQDDVDLAHILASAQVEAKIRGNTIYKTSNQLDLLSTGAAADIVSNTVGSFITQRMDQIVSSEPGSYRIRNRRGGGPFSFAANDTGNSKQVAFAMRTDAPQPAASPSNSQTVYKNNAGGPTVVPTSFINDAEGSNTSGFQLWVEGRASAYDDRTAMSDREGSFGIVHVGIDRWISESLIVGMMTSFDGAKETSDSLASLFSGSSEVKGKGWMAGPYVSWAITPQMFLDVRGAYGQSYNDVAVDILSVPYAGDFDTTRWLVQASLSGTFQHNEIYITPEATLTYMRERQKGFSVADKTGINPDLDVSSKTYDLGRLQVGPEIAIRREWDGGVFTPYLHPSLMWDFARSGDAVLKGVSSSDGDIRAAIAFGIRTESLNGVRANLDVMFDGVATSGFDAFSIGGELVVPF
jgi:hypothetical protein